jgi:hypothetical protein
MAMLSVLGSLVLTPLYACAAPQEPTSEFGAPLFVNGERIPDLEIKRFLSLGVGINQSNEARFGRIIEIELEMRAAAGEDVSKYTVSREEALKKFGREIDDFKMKFPTLEPDVEIGRAFLHKDLYIEQLMSAMLFDKLFFQENPDDWPDLTRSLIEMEYGAEWVEDARQSYVRRKEAAAVHNLDYIPPDDPIFVDALRSVILIGLNNFYIIETDPDEIQPGVLMSVEGLDVPVDEVFLRIQPYVNPEKIAEAKKWLVMTALLEDYLANFELPEEQGGGQALVPQQEFRTTFVHDGHSWDQELNEYDMVALQVMGFPSVQNYGLYKRLAESFARTVKSETDDDAILRPSLAHTNQITGAAKVTAEVILISAFDFESNTWKDGGWEWAEQRAGEVKKMLDEGADWKETLEHESELWDPPIPDIGHTPQYGRTFKGKFGQQTRNQILSLLSESEYRIFLNGKAITDRLFFDQKRGTIAGPFKGAHGYYIMRHMGQTPPITPLNLNEPVHRNIAVEYYVRAAMNAKVQELFAEAMEKGTIQGL